MSIANGVSPSVERVNVVPASGAAVTLPNPLTNGVSDITLTTNATITFPSLPTVGYTSTFMLALRQDSTGARTVTWPATVKWPGGFTPVLTSTANKTDIFTFTSIDGVNWLGFPGGLNF